MAAKKPVKKTPSKKEIEDAAASVEEAIAKLEVEEVETTEVEVPVGEETLKEETPAKSSEEKDSEEVEKDEMVENAKESEEETTENDLPEMEEKKEEVADTDTGTVFSKSSFEEDKKSGGSKLIITICLIIIFTILGFVGGYFYGKSGGMSSPAPTQTETVPTFTPTPTEEEEVDLSAYSIEVLNGSGVAGVAGDAQEALETDGFSVENTGNAENQDFTETVIAVKEDVPEEFITLLRNSLEESYVVESGTEELDEDNDYDVVVTIGSETVVDE